MTAASGLARSFAQLALARIGVGVGEAVRDSRRALADLRLLPARAPHARARPSTTSGSSIGILFGLALGGWLKERLGWRMTFAVVGLPGLLVALWVWLAIPEPRARTLGGAARQRRGAEPARDAALPGRAAELRPRRPRRRAVRLHQLRTAGLGADLHGAGAPAGLRRGRLEARPDRRRQQRGRRARSPARSATGSRGATCAGWSGFPRCRPRSSRPCYAVFALATDTNLALLAYIPVNLVTAVFAPPSYAIAPGPGAAAHARDVLGDHALRDQPDRPRPRADARGRALGRCSSRASASSRCASRCSACSGSRSGGRCTRCGRRGPWRATSRARRARASAAPPCRVRCHRNRAVRSPKLASPGPAPRHPW